MCTLASIKADITSNIETLNNSVLRKKVQYCFWMHTPCFVPTCGNRTVCFLCRVSLILNHEISCRMPSQAALDKEMEALLIDVKGKIAAKLQDTSAGCA